MKHLLLAILLVLVAGPASAADLVAGPDQSFLWNQFNSLVVVDSFALATSDFGLAVLKLDSVHGYFDGVNQLPLSNQAVDVKVSGRLATVKTSAGLAYFIDLSQLPDLSLIGETDIGTTVFDAALVGNDLYLACGFDGLRRYRLGSGNQMEFVDSCLTPVHCVQIEFQPPYLVVLDDYNGILRYIPSPSGPGETESIILVPRRVASFIMVADTVFMPVVSDELVYRAAFADGGRFLDSTYLSIVPDRVFAATGFMSAISAEDNLLETVSTSSGTSVITKLDPQFLVVPAGDTYYYQGSPHLALVSRSRTLISFDLPSIWYNTQPFQAYTHPGPVMALAWHSGSLATGGGSNPLELYELDSQLRPVFNNAFFAPSSVDALVDGGDVLYAHFTGSGQVRALRFIGDSVTTVSTLTSASIMNGGMKYYEKPVDDTTSLLLLIGRNFVTVAAVGDSRHFRQVAKVDFSADVEDAIVLDPFLLVSTVDRQLNAYRIFPSGVVYWWSIATKDPLKHMVNTGPRHFPDGGWQTGIVLGFDGNQMYEISANLTDPPVICRLGSLPGEVINTAVTPDAIYAVGPLGVVILDIRWPVPRVDEFGGYGGSMVAFGDSVLAISDGTAVHLYSYRNGTLTPVENNDTLLVSANYLRPNYPNPFNPRTRIDFYVPQSGQVEIVVYDLLGRRVTSLVDAVLTEGPHSVEWDGTDRTGGRVASGVYFYRMKTGQVTESRKMVLLK